MIVARHRPDIIVIDCAWPIAVWTSPLRSHNSILSCFPTLKIVTGVTFFHSGYNLLN
jgi:hypothetical protein